AGENNFNRLHYHTDPNILERAYAAYFESPGIAALNNLFKRGSFSSVQDREAVLLLFSLFAARNPRDRICLEDNVEYLNNVLVCSALGPEVLCSSEDLSVLKMNSSKHACVELNLIGDIHQCLLDRKWRFLQSSDDSPGFVTSDYPVTMIPHPSRPTDDWGLGFALKDVSVFIPLSRKYALLGDYGVEERNVMLDRNAVAAFNSHIIRNATRQVYAYSDQFEFFGPDNILLAGKELPNVI
ncbi:DUF4238 domain-containing protein, partial [Pseudomonas cichorii]|uniref:DUF4238 domain-containing protein n=1 Tax=Pseudomonas cichorii TaxID=36746 RepID=UPI0018E63439